MVIAIDFDGTITDGNNYPEIGNLRPYAKEVIQDLRARGYFCYLWTCREGDSLQKAKNWLLKKGIFFDGYNTGPSTGSPKLMADVYIDDMAYPNHGKIDWLQVAAYFNL